MEVHPERVFTHALDARRALAAHNYRLLDAACQKFWAELTRVKDVRLALPVVQKLIALVFEICTEQDDPDAPIGVDTWLMIGNYRYPDNPFRIFDEWRPHILDYEPADVAARSRYLLDGRFQQSGSIYVHEKGTEHKTVRLWLKAVPQQPAAPVPPTQDPEGGREQKRGGLFRFGRRDS